MKDVLLFLLGLLNFFMLQWFFVRLAFIEHEDGETRTRLFTIIKAWPLTGWWWNDYKYWGKKEPA